MRLFDDPLKTIVDGMVQAHGIRQQMLQARMEQARAKMMERDMQRREEDSQRSRQMQDIQFQQQMGDAARPVNSGTVEDPNLLPFAAPGMDAPASFPVLRKPDPSRLVKYKRADGQEMQYELLTPEEQQSKGLERLKAEQAAKMQAEEARQLRLRQILGPVELAQKRAELEMQSGFQASARDAQNTFTASENEKNRKAQEAARAEQAERQKRIDAETERHRKEMEKIGWTNATRPREGGGEARQMAVENSLRDDFRQQTGEFQKVARAYNRVLAATKDGASGVNDVALLYGYMKMLDPGSVVREGEFATAQNSAGVPDRVRTMVNNVLNGSKLSPQQRAEMLAQSGEVYSRAKGEYDALAKSYSDAAERRKADPRNVVMDIGLPQVPQSAPAGGGGVPTVGGTFNGEKVRKVTRIK